MEIVWIAVCVAILIVISKYSKYKENRKQIEETKKRWKDQGIFK